MKTSIPTSSSTHTAKNRSDDGSQKEQRKTSSNAKDMLSPPPVPMGPKPQNGST